MERRGREKDGIFAIFALRDSLRRDVCTRPGVQDCGMQISLVYPVVGRCHVRKDLRPPLLLFTSRIIGSAGIVVTREESCEDYLSSLFLSLNKK